MRSTLCSIESFACAVVRSRIHDCVLFQKERMPKRGTNIKGDGFARFMITFQRRHKAGTGRLKEVLAPLHDASGRKGGLRRGAAAHTGEAPKEGSGLSCVFFRSE